jgi:hypothetical protein
MLLAASGPFSGTGNLPTLIGNDKYALNSENYPDDSRYTHFNTFQPESNGTLELASNVSETDPATEPGGGWTYHPSGAITDDPTDHLAVIVYSQTGVPDAFFQIRQPYGDE